MRRALPLVAIAVIVAGCGSTHTVTDTVTRTTTVTSTATVTVVRHINAPVVRTQTTATPKPLTDSGNGTQEVALTIGTPSTIEWTNTGSFFDISGLDQTKTVAVDISSSASSGVSQISPGTYPSLTISTDGDWTIKIVANS